MINESCILIGCPSGLGWPVLSPTQSLLSRHATLLSKSGGEEVLRDLRDKAKNGCVED